ncbi:13874_t:CDS:2, partial [Gigaspora margarita]
MTTQSIEWFENAISKHFINKYNYEDFYCRIVDEETHEKISVYEWKNYNLIVVHKSLKHIIEMKEMSEKKIKALVKEIEKAYKNTNYNNNMANKTSKNFNNTLISQASSISSNTLVSKASSMKSTDTLISITSMNSSNTSISTVKRNSSKTLTVLNDSKSKPDKISVNEDLNDDLRLQSYKIIANNKNENFYDEISKKPDKIVSQSEAYTIYEDKSVEDKSIDEITLMSDNVSLSDSSIYSVPGITSLLEDFESHDIN